MPHSRNAPCPCGSGRKYKRCCLAREKLSASPRVTIAEEATVERELEGDADSCTWRVWSQGGQGVVGAVLEHGCDGLSFAIVDHPDVGPTWMVDGEILELGDALASGDRSFIDWYAAESYDFVARCERDAADPGTVVEDLAPLIFATGALAPRLAADFGDDEPVQAAAAA